MMRPSWTRTAPTGTSPASAPRRASARAWRMKSLSVITRWLRLSVEIYRAYRYYRYRFVIICLIDLSTGHTIEAGGRIRKDAPAEPHRPRSASAPDQARKAASFDEAMAAAVELKPMVGSVRRIARERRAALSKLGKMAFPPEQW